MIKKIVTTNMNFSFFNNIKNRLRLLDVDFSAPWWNIIVSQKRYLIPAAAGEALYSVYRPFMIQFFGIIFSSGRLDYFIYLFIAWIAIYIISLGARICYSMLVLQSVYSVHFNAHRRFLQIDSLYHSSRSKGTILGKIDRSTRAYEDLMEVFCLNVVQMTAGVGASLFLLYYHNFWLGAGATILLSLILVVNIFALKYFIIPYEKQFIKADDKVKSVCVENLVQINLIQTCFVDDQMTDKVKKQDYEAMYKESELSLLYNLSYFCIRFLYLASVALVAWYVFSSIHGGLVNGISGIALLLSYLRGTNEFIRIEKPLKYAIKSITKIKDLFSFVMSFDKKNLYNKKDVSHTYKTRFTSNSKATSIEIKNLFFDYCSSEKIFEGHTFSLQVSKTQKSKLYGIIGPSGIGKSTFFSILGGQIRPTSGIVLVNNVPMYESKSSVRRKVLSMQNQVATNIRGTLKYNLLFGLPSSFSSKEVFSDDVLIMLLKQIGLWTLFNAKKGLYTFVGEGGITLSGGQRQRLNFANLYLRALFYKPHVVLIDEPTSGLDVIGEEAITNMIMSLTKDAVTFVIAHRIETITRASGLIDFSLLAKEKEISIYSHNELKNRSTYYQQLLAGNKKFLCGNDMFFPI
jgi:ABC-type multidrug transport system fused ATPase/permease subunit